MKRQKGKEEGPPLPVSSLRLLVPPLRLVSAALWHVVEQRDVMDYGLVEEFVTSVLDIVPDMMTYRERIQLVMGLRAQLVLELCRPDHLEPPDSIQPHLNRMKTCVITDRDKKICDPEVEASGSNFLKLIDMLQKDPVEKEHFFQNIFPEEFGPKYHSALQKLMWDFLSRLEKLLPTPTLQQTVSWFLPDRCVLEECLQSVNQPQPLRTLLQHHTNTFPAPHTETTASGDQHILSSKSSSSPETQDALTDQADLESEHRQGFMSIQSPASSDIESEISPPLDYWENEQVKNRVEVMPLNTEEEPDFRNGEFVNKEMTEININDGMLDTESSKGMNTYEAFLNHHTDSGVNIHRRAFSHHEVQDISSLLLQPRILLQRLDISDMLLPESVVSSTIRKDGLQIDEGSQGKDEGEVISQSQSSVNPEPSETETLCSLVPDTSSTEGQLLRSKRVKICAFCGKTFREAKDLTAHVRIHTEPTPSHCILREQDFDHHENFQKHQQKVCEVPVQPEEDHMPSTFLEDSTEWAHNTLQRRRRMKKQLDKPGQTCSLCDKPFEKMASLKRHMKYKHGKKLCVNCGEGFKKSEFEKHKEECLMKCVSCSLCGDTFQLSETNQHEVSNQHPSKADAGDGMLPATTENVSEIHLPLNITPLTITTSHSLPFQKVNNYRTCLLCQESFVNREDMRMHLKFQHHVLTYPCFKCEESFQSSSDLQNHSNECSGKNISDSIKCPRCRLRTSKCTQQHQDVTSQEVNLKTLQPDLQLHADDIRVEIPQSSSMNVDSSNESQQHQPNHFMGQSNPADVVTWPGPQTANMCDEMNVQRSQDLIKDVNADQPLREVDRADRNSSQDSRGHGTENPQPQSSKPKSPGESSPALPAGVDLDCRTCHVCSKSFHRRKALTYHLRRHGEGPGGVKCSICSKNLSSNLELKRHLAKKRGCGSIRHNLTTAIAPRNYTPAHLTCVECLQQFTTKNKLKCHMVIHTGKGLSCRFCGRMFAESGSLDRHIRHHTNRPFLCDLCGKDFTTLSNLESHKTIHTSEQPYCCTICGKNFKWKATLKYHQMVHKGERPFACTLCKVRCRNNKQLKLHMMHVHTLERPFKCLGCGKGFVRNHSLRHHLSINPSCLVSQI